MSRWNEVYGEDTVRCEISPGPDKVYHPFAQEQNSCSDNEGCDAKNTDDFISVWKGANTFFESETSIFRIVYSDVL